MGVCTAYVENRSIGEQSPNLEKLISARLVEDFTIHSTAHSSTFIMIYQLSTKKGKTTAVLWKTLPISTSHDTIVASEQNYLEAVSEAEFLLDSLLRRKHTGIK